MAHPLAQTRREPRRARRVGAGRRAGAAARRSDARMAERAAARRSAPPAADVHGHGAARSIGAFGSTRRTSAGRRCESSAGREVLTVSPGSLVRQLRRSARIGLVAHCDIGKGRATIVADADCSTSTTSTGAAEHNLDAVLDRACHRCRASDFSELRESQTYPQASHGQNRQEQAPQRRRQKAAEIRDFPRFTHKIP